MHSSPINNRCNITIDNKDTIYHASLPSSLIYSHTLVTRYDDSELNRNTVENTDSLYNGFIPLTSILQTNMHRQTQINVLSSLAAYLATRFNTTDGTSYSDSNTLTAILKDLVLIGSTVYGYNTPHINANSENTDVQTSPMETPVYSSYWSQYKSPDNNYIPFPSHFGDHFDHTDITPTSEPTQNLS
jgi:hypothetical protein